MRNTQDFYKRELDKFCNTLKDTIKSFDPTSNVDAKPGNEEVFSNNINSMITDLATQIAPKVDARPIMQKRLKQQQMEIEKMKESIKRISRDIQLQTDKFNEEIEGEKRKFLSIANDLTNHYFEQRQASNEIHDNQMIELEDELYELKSTFDKRIADEKEKMEIEKKLLKKYYKSYQKKFDTMKDELQDDLNSTNMHIDNLEKEINKNYGQVQKQIDELNAELELRRKEGQEQLEKIEMENKELQDQIDAIKNENEAKIAELQETIDKSETNFEEKLQEALKANQPKLEAEIEAINLKYSNIENELNAKLDKLKKSKSGAAESLQNELLRLKSEVNSIDSKIAKRLKTASAQIDAKIHAKDNELKQLRSEQLKLVEATRNAYQNELSRIKNENENKIVLLEQAIMKSVVKNHNISRQSLNRLRVKEPQQQPSGPIVSQTPRRPKVSIPPITRTSKDDSNIIESLSKEFEIIDKESRNKFASYSNTKKKIETTDKSNKTKASARINEVEKQCKSIREEINALNENINNNIHTEQIIELSPRQIDLKNNIDQQKQAIQQLREEKDRLRIDVSKRKALQALQMKQRQDIEDIEHKINEASSNLNSEIEKSTEELVEQLKEEQRKSNDLIQSASAKLESALKELIDAKSEVEELTIQDMRKWGELRTGIADSTIAICKKLNNRPISSSLTIRNNTASILPPLKKEK